MKIPKFITFSLWSFGFALELEPKWSGEGGSCSTLFCRRLNLSHLLILICVIVFRLFCPAATTTATTTRERDLTKGSQKVSSFITCSNSSISLLTTRRHAKVRKICLGSSGLNHQDSVSLSLWDLYGGGVEREGGENVISKFLVLCFRGFQKAI